MTCHNCGCPDGALLCDGRKLEVTVRAENAYRRDRKQTVWVCSDECGVQALFVAKYGATHRAPMTLQKFRATRPLEKL